LPDYVVDAHSVNVFKNSLDRHWCSKNYFMIMSMSYLELETVVLIKLKCKKCCIFELRNHDAVIEAFACYHRSVDLT